jgi:hypothetical protein
MIACRQGGAVSTMRGGVASATLGDDFLSAGEPAEHDRQLDQTQPAGDQIRRSRARPDEVDRHGIRQSGSE